jgi:hypothetical protein
MSLNNIKLPDIVIADLYRHSLIQYDGPVSNLATPVSTKPEPVMESRPVVTETKPEVSKPVPAETKPKASEPVGYKILGNNKRHIAIIVNCPQDVFVPEADLQFLTKMLSACKLNMADVAIVNHAVAPVAIEPLKQQLQPEYVLLFGVEPGDVQLPISFPAFKEQPYAGSTYLFTPLLNELNQENDEAKQQKRKLWDCLKRMFL